MARFNTAGARPAVSSPVTSESVPSGLTHQGGTGYARDTKGELYVMAVSSLCEDTYYEKTLAADERYGRLVRAATMDDPGWTAGLLRWLRADANLRSAPLSGAVEFTRARLDAGQHGMSRQAIASVLLRGDEPAECLACWSSRYGRRFPKPLKRGVADAAIRLYDERSLLKWDSAERAWRFGDVLEVTHPGDRNAGGQALRGGWQGSLFKHAIDRRHGRPGEAPAELSIVAARARLAAWPVAERRALFDADPAEASAVLRSAGMTWEAVAGWLQGPMTAKVWAALAPTMGYMALLRNLRNMDEAGVPDQVAERVAARLAAPAQVARSRQLPMRFLAAHRAARSLRWAWALEQAITHSLANIPALPGRTLVLVDTSGSMNHPFSKDGTLARWDAAALFGIALASRCGHADVVSFSGGYYGGHGSRPFPLQRGESLLRAAERWRIGGYYLNGGTDTVAAVQQHLRPGFHDRVVVLTDEQAGYGDVGMTIPPNIPLYTWNLAGYRRGHSASGARNRHTFGGLTDQAFRMVPLIEAGRDGRWPWEQDPE